MPDFNLDTWLPVAVTLLVLFWGLRLVSATLLSTGNEASMPMIAGALTEKNDPNGKTSFSRVAGSIGSVGLAAFVIGLGVWVFFALNDEDPERVQRLSDIWPYLGGGAALFTPYAFNQLSNVFRGPLP